LKVYDYLKINAQNSLDLFKTIRYGGTIKHNLPRQFLQFDLKMIGVGI